MTEIGAESDLVGMREFQRRAAELMDELPLVLTRYGKPIAKVITYKGMTDKKDMTENVTTDKGGDGKGMTQKETGDSKEESVTKSVTQKEKGEQKLIKAPCSICRKFKRVALADVDGEEEFVCAKCLESEGLEWVL